jgi:starvation-inducible DNA-binding protein
MQKPLSELVALTLDAKQAHRHTTGPGFLPLRQRTDAMAADSRVSAEGLAERAVAFGLHVDARPVTVDAAAARSLLAV